MVSFGWAEAEGVEDSSVTSVSAAIRAAIDIGRGRMASPGNVILGCNTMYNQIDELRKEIGLGRQTTDEWVERTPPQTKFRVQRIRLGTRRQVARVLQTRVSLPVQEPFDDLGSSNGQVQGGPDG